MITHQLQLITKEKVIKEHILSRLINLVRLGKPAVKLCSHCFLRYRHINKKLFIFGHAIKMHCHGSELRYWAVADKVESFCDAVSKLVAFFSLDTRSTLACSHKTKRQNSAKISQVLKSCSAISSEQESKKEKNVQGCFLSLWSVWKTRKCQSE